MEKVLDKKQQIDLTEGPLFKKILLFSLPLMATGVLQLLFNAADLVIAGQMSGQNSLAAVGSCTSLINLIVTLFFGFAAGAGVVMAQCIGAKQMKDAQKVVSSSIIASLLFGVLVAIIGFFLSEPLLRLMNTAPALLEEAALYMKAYFFGVPAIMFYNYAASLMRATGDTRHPLIFLSVSGVVNVVLNVIVTLLLGPGFGALAVGIATAASNYVAAIEILIYMQRSKGILHLELKKLTFDKRQFSRVLRIGIPAGIQSALFSLSNVLIQSTINGYGEEAVAGSTASLSIEGFIYIALNAFFHTGMTFVGQLVGAKKYEKIRSVLWISSLIVTVVGVIMGILAFLFAEPLLGIYNAKSEIALRTGTQRLGIVAVTHFLCGLMETGCGVLRGMGKSVTPMVISLLGSCVFRIVWVYLICPIDPKNILILFYSYPISWILTTAAHYIFVFFEERKLMKNKTEITVTN